MMLATNHHERADAVWTMSFFQHLDYPQHLREHRRFVYKTNTNNDITSRWVFAPTWIDLTRAINDYYMICANLAAALVGSDSSLSPVTFSWLLQRHQAKVNSCLSTLVVPTAHQRSRCQPYIDAIHSQLRLIEQMVRYFRVHTPGATIDEHNDEYDDSTADEVDVATAFSLCDTEHMRHMVYVLPDLHAGILCSFNRLYWLLVKCGLRSNLPVRLSVMYFTRAVTVGLRSWSVHFNEIRDRYTRERALAVHAIVSMRTLARATRIEAGVDANMAEVIRQVLLVQYCRAFPSPYAGTRFCMLMQIMQERAAFGEELFGAMTRMLSTASAASRFNTLPLLDTLEREQAIWLTYPTLKHKDRAEQPYLWDRLPSALLPYSTTVSTANPLSTSSLSDVNSSDCIFDTNAERNRRWPYPHAQTRTHSTFFYTMLSDAWLDLDALQMR